MAAYASLPKRIGKISAPDITKDLDITSDELYQLLDLAADVKRSPAGFADALRGKSIAVLFEKPSLRTRLTFELAIRQLGGDSVAAEGPIGVREPLKDIARNLDRWVHAIIARTFTQETIDELARWSAVPVVNALTNLYHPCQALADAQTLRERFGDLRGLKVAFIGDGNNVAHSLMLTSLRLGAHFALACPPGYEPDPNIAAEAAALAKETRASVTICNDPATALSGAHAVYTDVWASMGQEAEAAERSLAFQAFQVNGGLLEHARPDAIFMHCLPARRGEETTDEVMESPQSAIFDQAENRLHAQKALLLMLLS